MRADDSFFRDALQGRPREQAGLFGGGAARL